MHLAETRKQSIASSARSRSNRGNRRRTRIWAAYAGLGRLDAAIEQLRRSLDLAPDQPAVHSNLLLLLSYSAQISPQQLFEEHRRFARLHADHVARLPPAARMDGPQRLRIGYVSADLRSHALAHFIEPVLASHDRSGFEVFCYSNNLIEDDVTRRLRRHAEHWRSVAGLDDDAAAQLIRGDAIDILVDLSGHTAGNRLLVFARRPAPIQITWLGYLGTSGIAAIDYRLTDARADPPGVADQFHTEQLVRLPACLWCYRPPEPCPPVNPLPALASGSITFGAFHNPAKVNRESLLQWARVLAAVPSARLVVVGSSRQADLCDCLAQLGVASDRLEFVERQPFEDYLRLHQRVDIALDTFPYSGGTTTFHALCMGVPTLTQTGPTSPSRSSASIQSALGLDEFVAAHDADLVHRAAGLPRRLTQLAELRRGLRDRMARTPLVDALRFTADLESTYRTLWSAHREDPARA